MVGLVLLVAAKLAQHPHDAVVFVVGLGIAVPSVVARAAAAAAGRGGGVVDGFAEVSPFALGGWGGV